MKKRLMSVLVLILCFAVVLSGCGNGNNSNDNSSKGDVAGADSGTTLADDEKSYTMRIGHIAQEDHPSHLASLKFQETVEAASNGRLKIEILPNGSLGGEAQLAEMVSLDSLEATIIGADAASGFIPEWGLIGLPYLFASLDAARNSLDGDFGAKLDEKAQSNNLKVLGWGEAGFRNVTNNKLKILAPKDLKGIKIRIMENPIHIALFKAFGANPTPMAFTELFTALQQGTVDAQENPITITTTSKFYEVQKFMTKTEHVYTAAPFVISKNFYDSLPADLQTIVADAGKQWTLDQRGFISDNELKYIDTLEENGMTITVLTPEEKKAFMDAAEVIYPDIYEQYGKELIDIAKTYNN